MLKQVVIGLATIGFLATPAVAQRYDPDAGSGNLVGPGGPVTADTPAYLGQRSGHAYNYGHQRYVKHHKKYKYEKARAAKRAAKRATKDDYYDDDYDSDEERALEYYHSAPE